MSAYLAAYAGIRLNRQKQAAIGSVKAYLSAYVGKISNTYLSLISVQLRKEKVPSLRHKLCFTHIPYLDVFPDALTAHARSGKRVTVTSGDLGVTEEKGKGNY